MTEAVRYREATRDDDDATFVVFRRSIWDYLRRNGLLPPDAPGDPPIEEAWKRWKSMYAHLGDTAAEHWVAEGPDGEILGYARSTERDGMLELTEFFVDPATQARGVGRGLLERAFPLGRGTHRSIIATQDPRAVSLYLRFGVGAQTPGVGFARGPEHVAVDSDLEVVPGAGDDATLEEVLAVEEHVLGHRREADVRYFLRERPAVLYRRAGRTVGYAFHPDPEGLFGPIAMLDPEDVPFALAHLETTAHEDGLERLDVLLPLANRRGVAWLLERGFHIEPFWILYLADAPVVRYDRYVTTIPPAIL